MLIINNLLEHLFQLLVFLLHFFDLPTDLIFDFHKLLVEVVFIHIDFLDNLIVTSLNILSLLLHQRIHLTNDSASKSVHLVIFLLMQILWLLNQDAAEGVFDVKLVIDLESNEVQIGFLLVNELQGAAK